MADDLEERLKSHARAFEGLISLIPAKHYYGEDTSDQWQRKKQTKKQKREAKRAKLDPSSYKSAKDVMDDNERKRKRELEAEDDSDIGGEGRERPQEGLRAKGKKAKMLKLNGAKGDKAKTPKGEQDDAESGVEGEIVPKKSKAEKRREKDQRKKEKQAKLKEKVEARKARKEEAATEKPVEAEQEKVANSDEDEANGDDIEAIDVSGLVEDEPAGSQDSAASTPAPGVEEDPDDEAEVLTETQAQRDAMKAKLQAQIKELRAQRKADSTLGKSGQDKQKMIDARRRKEELKKAARKELRKEDKVGKKEGKKEAKESKQKAKFG
ncbi:hypothetical protein BU16DRAFT_382838 [Lophium mytilinum]|uniref:Ribosomal RNA-processing protein 14 N-terminal domain-containing protein n=1 Tax=Lophium mytilinum TaxID=390894 RepID=A0A6A6QW62_9PEZI|nr:hypothetical protein BU16DRAFT_382838 [Lophium mytilinum]